MANNAATRAFLSRKQGRTYRGLALLVGAKFPNREQRRFLEKKTKREARAKERAVPCLDEQ